MSASAPPSAPDPRLAATRAFLHAGFVVTGAVTTVLGPILPLLMNRWSLGDAEAGFFFTLQFCGNLAGLAVLGVLLARWGYRLTISLGFTLMAAGVAGLLAAGPLEGRIATLVLGSGLALTISGVNLWVGEDAHETSERRASALSLLNMAWGLGAVAFPPLVVRAQRGGHLLALLLTAAGLCALTALFLAARGAEPRAAPAHVEFSAPEAAPAHLRISLILGTLFFLYVGAEACVSGWAATLANRIGGAASRSGDWALAPMFFWAGLLSGRALVPVILRKLSERALLLCAMALAVAATGALLGVSTFQGAAFTVTAAGVGMAAVYPLLAAWMFRHFGARTRHTANVFFALGCAGGATLPWLVGFTSSRAGSLRAGLLVPLASCVVMLALVAAAGESFHLHWAFQLKCAAMVRPGLDIQPTNGSRAGRRVMRLAGRLSIETVPAFLAAARKETAAVLMLDMGDLEYMDSSGVGALLQIHVSLAKSNRQLVLASVPEKVRMVLEIARLQSIFPMYSSVAIAEELLP